MKEKSKSVINKIKDSKIMNSKLTKEEIQSNLEGKVNQMKKSIDSTIPKFSRFPLQLQMEEIKDENKEPPKNTREFLEQKNKPKSYRVRLRCVIPEDEKQDAKEKMLYLRWYFFKHIPKRVWLRIQALTAFSDDKFVNTIQQTKDNVTNKFKSIDLVEEKSKATLNKLKQKKKEKFWEKFRKKYTPANILASALGGLVKLLFKFLWKTGILTFGIILLALAYLYQTSLYKSADGSLYITGNTPYFEKNNLFSMQTVYTFVEIIKDMIGIFFDLLLKLNLDFLANNTFLYIIVGFVVFQFMLQGIKKAKTQLIVVPILIMLTLVATTLL